VKIAISLFVLAIQASSASPAMAQMSAHTHEHPQRRSGVSPDVQLLLDSANKSITRYEDRRFAIANGYRLVGSDLPSMGEHWLNTRLLIDGVHDLAQPELLTYLKVDGRPVLTGVVYAIPLTQGQSAPPGFGPEAVWHEHNGAIDDEALLPEHHNAPSAVSGTRVAFVHAWLRVPHPGGVFAAENWAIPFVRAGLPVPEEFPDGAARALGLINGGRNFFTALMGAGAAALASGALDECTAVAAGISTAARAEARALTRSELDLLDAAWQRLLKEVAGQSGVETAKRINGGTNPH
jgi:hypothetical protein